MSSIAKRSRREHSPISICREVVQVVDVERAIPNRSIPSVDAKDGRQRDGSIQASSRAQPRRRPARSRSIRVARATRHERELAGLGATALELGIDRPRTRGECVDGPRPCPFVGCRHHLYLDVSPSTGTIKLNFPELEVWELTETCALDVADAGGQPLERASALLNVTRERIRQIEALALVKLGSLRDAGALRDRDQ
jgi:hypothetical protein